MPHLKIETNVPKSKIPPGLVKELCQVMSTTLGKPLNFCCATIVPDLIQSWGGEDTPSAQATLLCIGQLGEKENVKHSKVIYEAVCKGLGVNPDRMYVHFVDAKLHEVGYNGTTCKELFG